MSKKRCRWEEIVIKLRQVKVLQSQGMAVTDTIRQIGVSKDSHKTMANPLQYYEALQFFELETSCS